MDDEMSDRQRMVLSATSIPAVDQLAPAANKKAKKARRHSASRAPPNHGQQRESMKRHRRHKRSAKENHVGEAGGELMRRSSINRTSSNSQSRSVSASRTLSANLSKQYASEQKEVTMQFIGGSTVPERIELAQQS